MPDIRKAFHAELDQVRADVARLGGMVAEAIPKGTEILLTGDLVAAEKLIQNDDVLDALKDDIEERIYQILALQQPVLSGDLRVLITALRMTGELERSGDLMVNVAKAARRVYKVEMAPKVRGLIEGMSELSQTLTRRAMDAYVADDAALASAIDDMDDGLDDMHRDFLHAIFERLPEDQAELQACVQLALVARFYERIGDHAVNIGEWVTYLVTGRMHEPVRADPT